MGSENDPDSRRLTRRNFLIGSGALILGTGLAKATGNLPRINFGEKPLEEYDDRFLETIKQYPSSRFYYHNAAENPLRLEKALASPALNIEADVINFDDRLYIAHSLKEFTRDLTVHPEYIEEQKAETVFRKIVDSGKNPAIDIKPAIRNGKGLNLLLNSIADNIPEETVVTFSGEQDLVKEFTFRQNSIIVPTIFRQSQIYDYEEFAEKEWKNIDPEFIRVGATVNSEIWDDDLRSLLGYNRERGFESNVYTINDESRIITLLDWGATGITSDRESILTRANQTF